MGQDRKRGSRAPAYALDILHVVTGILVVVLAILAFLNPEDNMILFPVIFLLVAVLNFVNGMERFKSGRGQKKKKISGISLMAAGGGLLLLSVISAITIWWR